MMVDDPERAAAVLRYGHAQMDSGTHSRELELARFLGLPVRFRQEQDGEQQEGQRRSGSVMRGAGDDTDMGGGQYQHQRWHL